MRTHAPNSSFGWFRVPSKSSFDPSRPPASPGPADFHPDLFSPLGNSFAGLYLIRLNICGK
jgi:hypothetical protein